MKFHRCNGIARKIGATKRNGLNDMPSFDAFSDMVLSKAALDAIPPPNFPTIAANIKTYWLSK